MWKGISLRPRVLLILAKPHPSEAHPRMDPSAEQHHQRAKALEQSPSSHRVASSRGVILSSSVVIEWRPRAVGVLVREGAAETRSDGAPMPTAGVGWSPRGNGQCRCRAAAAAAESGIAVVYAAAASPGKGGPTASGRLAATTSSPALRGRGGPCLTSAAISSVSDLASLPSILPA